LLGRVEASLGETARAQLRLRASIAIARRTGAGYEEALSLRDYGAILHDLPAARPRAARMLGRAIRILTKMGAALDLADAEKVLEGEKAPSIGGTAWDSTPGSVVTRAATAVLTGTSASTSSG
jgi:hypothetical protein